MDNEKLAALIALRKRMSDASVPSWPEFNVNLATPEEVVSAPDELKGALTDYALNNKGYSLGNYDFPAFKQSEEAKRDVRDATQMQKEIKEKNKYQKIMDLITKNRSMKSKY